VFTGGQFGKVFVKNIKTTFTAELIDQTQAHKRKVVKIVPSKHYLYSCSLDQKVKQWSLSSFQMVSSFSLDWIPTTLKVDNQTLFVSGYSGLDIITLNYFDQSGKQVTPSKPTSKEFTTDSSSQSSSNIIIIGVGIALAVLFMLLIVVAISRLRKIGSKTDHIDKIYSNSTNLASLIQTETFVTTLIKLSFPAYKELSSTEFRTLKKLAEGGGGEIYIGEALSTKALVYGRELIVKKLSNQSGLGGLNVLKQMSFFQEISIMEFMTDCPLTARLIGYCTNPPCLVMKYYPFGSLYEWYDVQNVSEQKRVTVAVCSDLGRVLLLLNQRDIAHCDIKPQNILVEKLERFRFLLTDFGISKILTKEYLASEILQIRNIRGLTIAYAAPDAMQRFRKRQAGTPIEEKAGDVYSFGILISFLLLKGNPWS
jgi:hypothetical protein